MAGMTVEVAWTSTTFTSTPTFVDETSRVRSVEVSRGVSSDYGGIDPGTAVIVFDNRDRRFEPDYTGSALSPNVVERKQVKISYGGNRVFMGYTDTFEPQYGVGGKDSTCVVGCVDLASVLATTPAPNLHASFVKSLTPVFFYRTREELPEGLPPTIYGPANDETNQGRHGTYAGTVRGCVKYQVPGPGVGELGYEIQAALGFVFAPVVTYGVTSSIWWWMRSNAAPGNSGDEFFQDHATLATRTLTVLSVHGGVDDGKLQVVHVDTAGTARTATFLGPNSAKLNDGSWHLICFTKLSSSSLLRLHIDAVEMATISIGTNQLMVNSTKSAAWGSRRFTQFSNIGASSSVISTTQQQSMINTMFGDLADTLAARRDRIRDNLEDAKDTHLYDANFSITNVMAPVQYANTTALDAFSGLADSEGWPAKVTRFGVLQHHRRNSAQSGSGIATANTSQRTFSSGSYHRIKLFRGFSKRFRVVRVEQEGTGAGVETTTSAAGLHRLVVTSQIGDTTTYTAYRDWLVASNGGKLQVSEIELVNPPNSDAALDLLFRVTISWQPPGAAGLITGDTFIIGIIWRLEGNVVTATFKCDNRLLLAVP